MNIIPFQCTLDFIEDGCSWYEERAEATESLSAKRYLCEIQNHARQSGYLTTIGCYGHGYYIVIPLKNIGSNISIPEVAHWNTEHIIQAGGRQ